MKKVLVETIYTFKHSYLCEIPDEYPAEWAMDIVAMEDAGEFTQEGLGETILGHRVVTEKEAVDYFNEVNKNCRIDSFRIKSTERYVTPWSSDK